MTTSIIIPVFNNVRFLSACVDSIINNTHNFEIILVDNNSNEPGIHQWYASINNPAISIIKNQTNLGFGKANNGGFKKSRGDYIVLMNSDMLATPNWLPPLIERLESSSAIGAVQSKIMLADDNPVAAWKTQTCGARFSDDGMPVYYLNGFTVNAPEVGRAFELEAFMGTGVLLRRSAIEQCGFFDEAYDLVFMEDTDLSLRFSQAGYAIWYEPRSLLYHFHSASMPHLTQADYDRSRLSNAALFKQKWPNGAIVRIVKKQGF